MSGPKIFHPAPPLPGTAPRRPASRPYCLGPWTALLTLLVACAVWAAPKELAAQQVEPSSSSGQTWETGADTAANPVRLTLQEAVRRALEDGEEVELVRESIRQAEEEITQVRAGALPQVSGNLRYTRQLRSIFDDVGGGEAPPPMNGENGGENPFADLPFGRPNTWVASLSINQTLYAAGQVSIGLEIADRVRTLLQYELDERQQELTREVREAYFQAVFSDELVDISREALELADRQLQEVESFQDQGLASELDVLTARVERDNLEPQIVEARNAARLSRQNLRRLVNLPRDRELELVTRLDAELVDVDRDALEALVLERPALMAASEQVRIEQDQVRLARAGYRPTASAFAELGYQSFPATVLPQERWREDWNVGVQVSVPIFNGFRTRAEVEEARSGVRRSELERQQINESLLLEFDATLGDFDAALSQIEARRSTVRQAERALELAELRFGAGSATALELSNARLNLQQSRVNEVEALLSYVEALAALERVTGGDVPLVDPRIREAASPSRPPGEPGSESEHDNDHDTTKNRTFR